MENTNNVEMHSAVCEQLNKIYEQKNHDYGDSFHETFVEEGMAMARIRLSDKLNRFKRLSKLLEEGDEDQQKVADESIEDTLMDLANYAIMTVMEMRREAADVMGVAKLIGELHGSEQPVDFADITVVCTTCGTKLERAVNGRSRLVCPNCGKVYG